MAITPIEFGKNLRPSTVDVMNKLNEVITAVNGLDPSDIQQIESDVSTLKTQMSTANSNITALQGTTQTNTQNISTLTTAVGENTNDINDVKTTLYTPLEAVENNA